MDREMTKPINFAQYDDYQICKEQETNTLLVYWFGKLSDWSVIVINFAMRYFVIWLVKKLSYRTRSQESRDLLIYIFIIQFINTGPFLLLANADMSESGIPLLNRFFKFG